MGLQTLTTMSVVHYKFKSALEYDHHTFDGLTISLGELKKAIASRKLGKNNDFDLQIVNAQDKHGERLQTNLVAFALVTKGWKSVHVGAPVEYEAVPKSPLRACFGVLFCHAAQIKSRSVPG